MPVIPKRAKEELDGSKLYYEFKERCIYCDIIRQESQSGTRLVTETDRFIVVEPYAARFPFETWIIPKRHSSHFEESDAPQLQNLAWVLRTTLRKLDKTLERPPYNFVIHMAPVQEPAMSHYHWHIEILPIVETKSKSYSIKETYFNAVSPEQAAEQLRSIDS